jgi:signal transduction histidine kinase
MLVSTTDPGALQPKELEVVYAISRAVAQSDEIDEALDEVIRLSRSIFIYDNMVIYLRRNEGGLEARYARVIGRGRSAEADLAWGDQLAREVFRTSQTMLQFEVLRGHPGDRLAERYFLGLPLGLRQGKMGALVFGRFGGPPYEPPQIHLAEFVALHIAQLLRRQQLVGHIASLEAEQRLSLLQQDFIAMVSHELCTPLGFIKGYATTLLRPDTEWDADTRREFLTIIDEEADRLRDLIDGLLDSSRLQSGTLRLDLASLRLDTLLRDIVQRAISRYESLKVKLDLQSGVSVQADATRLAQVFDNLLVNAVKYAPGAPVTVTLRVVENWAQVTIKDAGPGIAPEHQAHLFGRFYRVPGSSAVARGTGLGLFICQHLVLAHHGEIAVESEVGKGTTFTIRLPAKPAK